MNYYCYIIIYFITFWCFHKKYSANCICPNTNENIDIVLSYLSPYINNIILNTIDNKYVFNDTSLLYIHIYY